MSSELSNRTISFRMSSTSGVPAYLQLVQQVEHALRMGALGPGDRLPTVKEVVGEIALNPNTVLKAYRELEVRGLVEGKQGVGTFVLARPSGPPPGTQERLSRSLQTWVRKARGEGLDDSAIEALVRSALAPAAGSSEGAA